MRLLCMPPFLPATGQKPKKAREAVEVVHYSVSWIEGGRGGGVWNSPLHAIEGCALVRYVGFKGVELSRLSFSFIA